MLCSRCSEVVRPVVMLDIDGMLGDYHGHFIGFAEMWLDVTLSNFPTLQSAPQYMGSMRFRDWFCRTYDVDLTTFREIKLAYRQGAQKRSMPLNPGMDVAVRAIVEGLPVTPEVWITTTRPYLNLSGIDADTRFWLNRHKIPYDYLVYDENKYVVLADRIDISRVVLVADDEVENLKSAYDSGYNPGALCLYRTRYNKRAPWHGQQVNTPAGLIDLTAKNLDAWSKRNG